MSIRHWHWGKIALLWVASFSWVAILYGPLQRSIRNYPWSYPGWNFGDFELAVLFAAPPIAVIVLTWVWVTAREKNSTDSSELIDCPKCGRKNRIGDPSRRAYRCGFCKESLFTQGTDDAEEIAEAPLTYWRDLCAAFVLNVVASLMTLPVVFLIMIPVALSLALADRAGLVVLEHAFRSILPFAQVCGLIFGGLPWAVRLWVRRGIKFLGLAFEIAPHRAANRLLYVESLKVAWAYMWPNFIVVAVMAAIVGEGFQVLLPLAIFLQPFLFRRAFNGNYRNFSLTAQMNSN